MLHLLLRTPLHLAAAALAAAALVVAVALAAAHAAEMWDSPHDPSVVQLDIVVGSGVSPLVAASRRGGVSFESAIGDCCASLSLLCSLMRSLLNSLLHSLLRSLLLCVLLCALLYIRYAFADALAVLAAVLADAPAAALCTAHRCCRKIVFSRLGHGGSHLIVGVVSERNSFLSFVILSVEYVVVPHCSVVGCRCPMVPELMPTDFPG